MLQRPMPVQVEATVALFSLHHLAVGELESIMIKRAMPLVKSAYQKINFFISQPKHMLRVLKRTVLMRRFF